MTTNGYIGYFGGALIVVPAGALIAQYASAWVAGFRPRYSKALISTVIAYVAVNLVGMVAYYSWGLGGAPRSLQLLVSLAVLSCCHAYLFRSEAGDRLSPGKAFLVALCQVIGAAIVLVIVLLLLLGLKRLFT